MAQITYTGNGASPLTFDSDVTTGDPAYGWERFEEAPRPRRQRERRYRYPGVDGEAIMRLGAESVQFGQTGMLRGSTEANLESAKAAIRAQVNGKTGTLNPRGTGAIVNVILESVRFFDHARGHRMSGGSPAAAYFERYEIVWRQLAP